MSTIDIAEANDWWDTLQPEEKEKISGFHYESYANLWFDLKPDREKYMIYIDNTVPIEEE